MWEPKVQVSFAGKWCPGPLPLPPRSLPFAAGNSISQLLETRARYLPPLFTQSSHITNPLNGTRITHNMVSSVSSSGTNCSQGQQLWGPDCFLLTLKGHSPRSPLLPPPSAAVDTREARALLPECCGHLWWAQSLPPSPPRFTTRKLAQLAQPGEGIGQCVIGGGGGGGAGAASHPHQPLKGGQKLLIYERPRF